MSGPTEAQKMIDAIGTERAKELARKVSAVFAGEKLPVVATALTEVMAILLVWLAEDEPDKQREYALRLAGHAVEMAGAINSDILKAAADMEIAEEKRHAELLATPSVKRKSPWGEPR